jgi:hypothetical protein
MATRKGESLAANILSECVNECVALAIRQGFFVKSRSPPLFPFESLYLCCDSILFPLAANGSHA